MSVNLNSYSIVSFLESAEKHRCGYCKNENSSISNGMWAEQLTVEDYQDLIDRGWRRSGKYCYKPIMVETCCPQYTIRCDALNISLSKSQKKVLKRVNKFLENGVLNKKDFPIEASENQQCDMQQAMLKNPEPVINLGKVKQNLNKNENEITVDHGTGEPFHTESVGMQKNSLRDDMGSKQENETNSSGGCKKGLGPDCAKPPCKKAKLLRIERKKEKLNKMGLKLEDIKKKTSEPKSIEEFIENISENSKFKLKMQLYSCNNFQQITLQEEYDLYSKYQMIVHNDPPEKLSFQRFKRFLVNSPLKIRLERMNNNNATFKASAKLFAKYQMLIHNDPTDECDEVQFSRFLVHTPLKPKDSPSGEGPGFGSFHQQYWLDDKLIAVGVIDILPRCVSSVYLFYDPEYASLSLGTYSSLREVYLTRSLQKVVPDLCYYYMGFYIHSCPKMRYKGKLTPSYLLCPESYSWIPIEESLSLLEANKYSRLCDQNAVDDNRPTDADFLKAKIVYDHQFMSLATLRKVSMTSSRLFNQIGVLVGRICLQRMVFWIQ